MKTLGKKTKTVIAIACVIAFLILFVPIKLSLKDGGTVVYSAVVYSVYKVHSLWKENGVHGYMVGTRIEFLGIIVHDNCHFESE